MISPSSLPSGRLILLRFLAVAGAALSGFLIYQKVTGSVTYLHGCGTEAGCAQVLGSRWSQWFHVPVAAFSLLLYLALLPFSFRPRGAMLTMLGAVALAAPLWFGGLQIFNLHRFCPWCLAAHLIGLACGVIVFTLPPLPGASRLTGFAAAAAALALLITGQVFGPVPATHFETTLHVQSQSAVQSEPQLRTDDSSLPVQQRGAGSLAILGGKSLRVRALPHLGNPDAPHHLVIYFDYACDSCRDVEEDLQAALDRYPGQLCVIFLPCPIDRASNPYIPPKIRDHPHAADLARLGMACWRTDPASFPAVHTALFRRPVLELAAARTLVAPLLHVPLQADALQDPWIDEILKADFEDYRGLMDDANGPDKAVMPKLILDNGKVIHGVMQTREALFQKLEKELGLHLP